jgi:ribosome-associated protein
VRTANETKTKQNARKTKTQAAPARRGAKGKAAARDADDDHGLTEARTAVAAAIDNKAVDPVLLDVHGLCSYTSYILIVSGRSDRHVESMREGISKAMRERGHYPLSTEGVKSGQWALLDYGDCVVHVFYHATREHYDLEGLWIDAQRVPIDVPAEARSDDDGADESE